MFALFIYQVIFYIYQSRLANFVHQRLLTHTQRQISPFSILTATVSKLLLLLMPQIDASITFPNAPWPKTFPVSGERTGKKTTEYSCSLIYADLV